MNKKNILLLTLVHPDFLPPVYAVAQALRDLEYNIHILTFDSFVPAQYDLGSNITIESIGTHHDSSALERIRLRSKFTDRAKELTKDHFAIITFCPFSFKCGLEIKNNTPIIYVALEIADFTWAGFLKSPLSNYRNLMALRDITKADLVATPSAQRSAWLAGRCHLDFMPHVILNTSYINHKTEADTYPTFKELVPADFLNKKIVLYTGAVNKEHCILELIEAFDKVNDPQSALVITGIKDTPYCQEVKTVAGSIQSKSRIKLFPYVTRMQMLALQANAHIGACLENEYKHSIRSKMMAPNKAGEYLSKKLYILGVANEYFRPFEMAGIASLAEQTTPDEIGKAISGALKTVRMEGYQNNINDFVNNYFCMQQQIKPIVNFLNEI